MADIISTLLCAVPYSLLYLIRLTSEFKHIVSSKVLTRKYGLMPFCVYVCSLSFTSSIPKKGKVKKEAVYSVEKKDPI